MNEPFYVREADGHNHDIIHKFLNEMQAAKYVGKRASLTATEVREMWKQEGIVEDADLNTWMPDGPPAVDRDHTQEE